MTDTAEVETAAAAPVEVRKAGSLYEQSKALAVRGDGGAGVPMPTNFAQMQDFASAMAKAGPMIGKPFRENPGACLAIITQSMRWGMDPYAVSQKAYVAAQNGDGPIGYEGQLVAAVITSLAPLQKRLRCEYSGEGDDRRITVIGFLKGEDEAFTYTSPPLAKLRPAKNASGYLKGSQLWETDPDQQLWYYGIRAWARKWTPDVIMGVYTPDELSDIARGDRQVTEAEVVTLGGGGKPATDTDNIPDAEFCDGTAVLARAAEAKKGGDAPKAAAAKSGDAVGENAQPATDPAAAGSASTAGATNDAGGGTQQQVDGAKLSGEPGDAQAQTATAGAGESSGVDETDEQLVARIEAEVKAARYVDNKKAAIMAARGALERIRQTGDVEDVVNRASALLKKFDLSK